MNSKKDELVSIIVPIYNVEKCILSLINQTYKNIEIILVDDGSIDSSGEICDYFGERDSRIVVIHKEIGGITSARRTGIERATGRYIGFVDGDDWVELNMYEEMLDVVQTYSLDIFATAIYRDNDIGTYAKWSAALIDEGLYRGEDKLNFDTKILCGGRQ